MKPETLCHGLPGNTIDLIVRFLLDEFAKYMSLVSKLEFEERPDYYGYRQMFNGLL